MTHPSSLHESAHAHLARAVGGRNVRASARGDASRYTNAGECVYELPSAKGDLERLRDELTVAIAGPVALSLQGEATRDKEEIRSRRPRPFAS